ncbi:Glutamyl aminopeptidase-like 3 [Homarus americanus]|uniref:Aminopeptidase n=1 Tax=Homarus americanus TaxID=6706 RepID=A0A8J5THR4_HOMAM|nr:Glutamyl aminopeptidase-like 3 [Homarus americanus]
MPEQTPKKLKTGCNPWEDSFRLPKSVQPDHYSVYLHPDLSTKTFSGKVSIDVTTSEALDHFLVHTKWLSITQTKLVRVNGNQTQDVPLTEAFEYEPNEFWVIRTASLVESGTFRVTMNFSGSLQKGIVGFYYSEYTDQSGNRRGLATTKFEPTYARRAFPCFDEPSFKSTYKITIVRPSDGYIALSNMPVMEEVEGTPARGLTEVVFNKSVPMVTYLVCFIVCDFTYKEKVMSSGMPFRVYAPSGRLENSQYALDTGASILQMYETMFDLPFPLPKSDMAAIPDYSSGATEHWGIITFRETAIFYNKSQSSASNKQRVASVIAHELAHQWFGNLMTLDWWNDLWLNEGFASYVEFKGVDHIHPDWDMDSQFCISNLQDVLIDDSKLCSHPIVQKVETADEINAMFDSISYDKESQFLTRNLQVVMKSDSCLSSHPIVKCVDTTDQINAMFDVISYKKGSSVLRMLENFMGEAAFQKGINSFLKKYAYDNAVTQDLWAELTAAWSSCVPDGQKSDVGAIMDTWTRQMGYPVVTMVRTSPETLVLTQKRFLQDPTAKHDRSCSEFEYKWDIPISYFTSSDSTTQRAWLYRKDGSLTLKIDPGVTWVKVNVQQKGYYRVNYETNMWKQLEKLCADKVVGTAERANLYNDVFALADAALVDYSVALNFSRGLASETDYVPWDSVYTHLIVMTRLLAETKACQPFQVYRWGMVQSGSQENWEVMWQRSLVEQCATEQDNFYFGLANAQDKNILQRYIELAQDEKNVRSQNLYSVLLYISDNPAGTDLVWDWVRSNWEWLVNRYTLNDRYLGQLIFNISKYFSTSEKLTQMEKFFTQYPDAGAGELNRQQALESIRLNIRWVKSYSTTILNWLNSQKK